jgi:peptidoglycan hydrolase-like protein with peptidoglycan-binding domain
MKARRSVIYGLVALLGATSVGLAYANSSGPRGSAAASTIPTSVVPVSRRDLTDSVTVDGALGYGPSSPVSSHLQGTVTWTPSLGDVVDRGQALYRIDNSPVILMFGSVPAYRALRLGVSDGPDVKQLEDNLIALGYASPTNLVANGHFDAYDAAAVKRWEKALGLDQDGVVPLGRVVFLPGSVRIDKVNVTGGGQAGPGSPVVEVTSTQRIVTIDLDARRQDLAVAGAAVQVMLANGKTINGKISEVGKVATTVNNQTTLKVYVTLDDPASSGTVDQAPVKVAIASQTHKAVLAVPVNALLALADGSYAVEVSANGNRSQVPVKTGLFAQGMVEISGEGITEGTFVVVPVE